MSWTFHKFIETTNMDPQARVPASAESGMFTRLEPLPNTYTSDIALQRMLGCKSSEGMTCLFFSTNVKKIGYLLYTYKTQYKAEQEHRIKQSKANQQNP